MLVKRPLVLITGRNHLSKVGVNLLKKIYRLMCKQTLTMKQMYDAEV